MTAAEFAALVPELCHRTPWKNLPGIRRHGLLSTAQLLALYGVDKAGAAQIEQQRAKLPVCVPAPATHPEWEPIWIGDQHQIHPPQMAAALPDLTPEAWRAELNARVFFWPTRERLAAMQRTYRRTPGVVLVVNTATLVAAYEPGLSLSRINTGFFRRKPALRTLATYQALSEFPVFRPGRKPPLAEVSVRGGLPDIWKYVIRLESEGGESPAETPEPVKRLSTSNVTEGATAGRSRPRR